MIRFVIDYGNFRVHMIGLWSCHLVGDPVFFHYNQPTNSRLILKSIILTDVWITTDFTRTTAPPPMSVVPVAQEIVIDEHVDNVLHSGALRERLQNESLGEGTVTLIVRDPNITIIGDMNLDYDDRRKAPLYGCKFLLRVNLKGCTKLTQLGNYVFEGCSSLTSVSLPNGLTQMGDQVFYGCSSLFVIV